MRANRTAYPADRADGFTLIELLTVMTIIAILLTIAVPRYFNSIDRSKEVTLRQDLNVMRDAIDKFQGDTGALPQTLDELVSKKYLRAVPVDPMTESPATWQLVAPQDPKKTGVQDVRSGAPGKAQDGTNFQDW
ncbi:MAG: prepilin-type N-terminal cleavage/methylation domain-containing protein [Betaproteobacteria bacterium]|nr:MAG: prepilin-type N-terminal cleavage/methylation domain-containing protein [Betaproteobacteria bacterium]